jgi:hypothetical protein
MMSIPAIAGVAPTIKTMNINPFADDASSMSVSDMFMKEASKLSGQIHEVDTNVQIAAQGDLENPLTQIAIQKQLDKGLVMANYVAKISSQVPKALELLNK